MKAKASKKQNNNKSILAANMWAIYNFGNPNERYQRFLRNGRPFFKSLIENILLYDEVIIPTQDFMSLSLLIGVLGEKTVLALLDSNSLKFLRLNGALCYIGNGGGVKGYQIVASPNGQHAPFCAPIDEAITWAIDGLNKKPKDPTLVKKVFDSSSELKIDSFSEQIKHETYKDIIDSSYLRTQFSIINAHLDHLAGIGPAEVRIYGGPDEDSWKGDEIDTLMLLASTNLELLFMEKAECEDLATSNPVGHILKAKAERNSKHISPSDRFTDLREIDNIPDVGEGIITGNIDITQLLKLKHSKNGQKFREWFHSHSRGNPNYIAKAYIELLKQEPKISSLPARIIRFIVTSTIGFIPIAGHLLGPASNIMDSFFLERLLRGCSPKFFIEDMKQIPTKQSEQK